MVGVVLDKYQAAIRLEISTQQAQDRFFLAYVVQRVSKDYAVQRRQIEWTGEVARDVMDVGLREHRAHGLLLLSKRATILVHRIDFARRPDEVGQRQRKRTPPRPEVR